MPILPLIDLLILMGSGSLAFGFALKAIALSTQYRTALLGLTPIDFLIISAICFGMALTLAARTWVKLHEPRLLALQRDAAEAEARRRAEALDYGRVPDAGGSRNAEPAAVGRMGAETAGSESR